MKLAYQYRLQPTNTQQRALWSLLSVACRVSNDALKERKEAWETEHRTVTYLEQALKLTERRRTDKALELLNHSAAPHVLRRLEKAFRRFFDGLKKVLSSSKSGSPAKPMVGMPPSP